MGENCTVLVRKLEAGFKLIYLLGLLRERLSVAQFIKCPYWILYNNKLEVSYCTKYCNISPNRLLVKKVDKLATQQLVTADATVQSTTICTHIYLHITLIWTILRFTPCFYPIRLLLNTFSLYAAIRCWLRAVESCVDVLIINSSGNNGYKITHTNM